MVKNLSLSLSHSHILTNTLTMQYNDKPLHYETISSQSVQLSDLLSWVFTHGRAHTEAGWHKIFSLSLFPVLFTSRVHGAKRNAKKESESERKQETEERMGENQTPFA